MHLKLGYHGEPKPSVQHAYGSMEKKLRGGDTSDKVPTVIGSVQKADETKKRGWEWAW